MIAIEPRQRRWLAIYGLTLAALVGLALCLNLRLPSYRQPPVDFYAMKPDEIFNVYGLTRRQAGSVKLGFAEAFAPPEIGLYGNHISEFFGADAFGRPGDTAYFFNYSYANLSLPEIHRFLRHIERLGRLPKRLLLVQVTPPNADNGQFIINWGNELPPDVLLSDLGRGGLASDGLQYAGLARELVNNWLHEVLNYNTFIWGVVQSGSKGRVVSPTACQGSTSAWWDRVPYTLRSTIGAFAGHQLCERHTWWGALRRDGSADAELRGDEKLSGQREDPLVQNEDPLKDTDRGLNAGDDVEIARHMRAIDALGRRHNVKVIFIVPPVYETDRHDSVVNRIFNRALALVPDITAIDSRSAHADASLFKSSLHPSPKYYRMVVEELRRRGLVE